MGRGYPNDGRADNDSYPHDCRANNAPNRHGLESLSAWQEYEIFF